MWSDMVRLDLYSFGGFGLGLAGVVRRVPVRWVRLRLGKAGFGRSGALRYGEARLGRFS